MVTSMGITPILVRLRQREPAVVWVLCMESRKRPRWNSVAVM